MKTKAGKGILNENSKRHVELNDELQEIAFELKNMRPHSGYKADVRNLIKRYKANRTEWQRLQDEITDVIGIEQWVDFK